LVVVRESDGFQRCDGMKRRTFIVSATAGAAAVGHLVSPPVTQAASLKGRIRKSLKWGMVKDKSLTVVEAFRKLRSCGYEGVEPRMGQEIDVDEWIAASKESGLVVDCVAGGRPFNLVETIDLLKKLGGDSILATVPVDEKKSFRANWDESVAAFKAAAPHAEKQGIRILIENVWASFLISALDMQRFVDEIAHPFVGVHYDVGNVVRWGVAEHWMQVLGKRIGKLDIKEFSLDVAMTKGLRAGFQTPVGEGSVNWPAVREELEKLEFSGWAAAEVQAGDWDYLADVSRRMDQVLGLA
jgi:L-ribulose-5-phosphate 3-epimerase